MKQSIIGIDPDSEKHGVAYYQDGDLLWLETWSLTDVVNWLVMHHGENMIFAIEDVASQNFAYTRKDNKTPKVMFEKGRALGKCQQSQIELMRLLDAFKVPYQLYKPMRGNWAENKEQFQKTTGWRGRSNKDTRSAAFFGYLALKKQKVKK